MRFYAWNKTKKEWDWTDYKGEYEPKAAVESLAKKNNRKKRFQRKMRCAEMGV